MSLRQAASSFVVVAGVAIGHAGHDAIHMQSGCGRFLVRRRSGDQTSISHCGGGFGHAVRTMGARTHPVGGNRYPTGGSPEKNVVLRGFLRPAQETLRPR